MGERKFWIRKDRERYLLGGTIITCLAAGLITAHWHFTDRTQTSRGVRVVPRASRSRQQNLRELQFTTQRMTVGSTSYYHLGENTKPSVPRLGEKDEN